MYPTGSLIRLNSCFWFPTHLTDVTVDMEAAVQSDYPDRLLLTLLGHDGLPTN